ncbi:phosphoenolpyruvate-dependent sugar phosphotransferase system eiia 2 [Lucifera butyrica]|uniref:Phosphoenolpyruvate-dependent sugar phosphotransferase system eiia 2 n=1 Tax=Lucifera butyrica TaxID=1351585 RepID=A0A498R531_9FIRM|nr:PTS sugar transporter subunit IIA [Lucifera butyrica]VBB07816.1 phosphoenolpyruvate-dependent sugar phosphotransferase system eiia 2 [Lucifera butyrica]
MKIVDLLNEDRIVLGIDAATKEDVWRILADTFVKSEAVSDVDAYLQDVKKREEHGTTGVGFGIAIPHAKSAAVIKPALAMGRLKNAVDVQSLDGTRADLFFLIAAPEKGEDIHLRALSKLARMLMHESFLKGLRQAATGREVREVIEANEV